MSYNNIEHTQSTHWSVAIPIECIYLYNNTHIKEFEYRTSQKNYNMKVNSPVSNVYASKSIYIEITMAFVQFTFWYCVPEKEKNFIIVTEINNSAANQHTLGLNTLFLFYFICSYAIITVYCISTCIIYSIAVRMNGNRYCLLFKTVDAILPNT